jgi:hypothetical protein
VIHDAEPADALRAYTTAVLRARYEYATTPTAFDDAETCSKCAGIVADGDCPRCYGRQSMRHKATTKRDAS